MTQQPARQREQHVRAHKRLSTGEQEQQQSLLPYSSSSYLRVLCREECMPNCDLTKSKRRSLVALRCLA